MRLCISIWCGFFPHKKFIYRVRKAPFFILLFYDIKRCFKIFWTILNVFGDFWLLGCFFGAGALARALMVRFFSTVKSLYKGSQGPIFLFVVL